MWAVFTLLWVLACKSLSPLSTVIQIIITAHTHNFMVITHWSCAPPLSHIIDLITPPTSTLGSFRSQPWLKESLPTHWSWIIISLCLSQSHSETPPHFAPPSSWWECLSPPNHHLLHQVIIPSHFKLILRTKNLKKIKKKKSNNNYRQLPGWCLVCLWPLSPGDLDRVC